MPDCKGINDASDFIGIVLISIVCYFR